MISLLVSGCGWLLDEPPLYPDQGVASDEQKLADEDEMDMNEEMGGIEEELSTSDPMSNEE